MPIHCFAQSDCSMSKIKKSSNDKGEFQKKITGSKPKLGQMAAGKYYLSLISIFHTKLILFFNICEMPKTSL